MDQKSLPQKWINTPFSYTKLSQNLTLLQQNVLVKVSSFLQKYIQDYFGTEELRNSPDRPKPLFSELTKKTGVGQIVLSYAELGVSANNYPLARTAVHEVLDMKWESVVLNADGKPEKKTYNIFTEATEDINPGYNNSQGVMFSLNKEMMETVVDQIFDMQYGYVSHPEDIARIASMEKVPMLYYLLKHKTRDWKQKVIELTPFEVKDYFGMVERDINKNITKIQYKKFSQFKERVLTPAMIDINRLHRRGLIDMSLKYTPIYVGKKTVGDPASIRFLIDTEKMRKLKPYEEIWLDFLDIYDGVLKEIFEHLTFHEFVKGAVVFEITRQEYDEVEARMERVYNHNEDERAKYEKACKKVFKKKLDIKYMVMKQ